MAGPLRDRRSGFSRESSPVQRRSGTSCTPSLPDVLSSAT